MGDQGRFATSPPRRRPGAPILLALCLGLSSLHACSLLVETRDQQCSVDADCVGFTGARCDLDRRVCALQGSSSGAATTSSTSTGGGCDGGGCYACPPTTTEEFLNACTDAGCKSFANAARLQHLTTDGGLPPLPEPDGG